MCCTILHHIINGHRKTCGPNIYTGAVCPDFLNTQLAEIFFVPIHLQQCQVHISL